ncbi:MAG: acetyltransferase [Cytophagales bacterium]|nr:acetyltransferase [Cytophagales bacterium]
MEKPVIIIGAGGLGKVTLDIFTENNVVVYCLLDDDETLHNTEIGDVSVMGATDEESFLRMIGKDCEAFIASNETEYKKNLVEKLKEEYKAVPVNAIHQTSYISTTTNMGHGNLINAKVTLGTNAKLGSHCIVNTGAIVDYEAKVGDFVQIGTGAMINSGAIIEDDVFIGAGVTIVSGVTVKKGARVGAGSVVIADVEEGQTVFGNPAKSM